MADAGAPSAGAARRSGVSGRAGGGAGDAGTSSAGAARRSGVSGRAGCGAGDAGASSADTGGRGVEPRVSRRAIALEWGFGGLLAAPFAILPHELGHYVVLLALGAPGLALHYSHVTWDLQEFWGAIRRADFAAADEIAPLWGVAAADAAGPLATYALVAACCWGCARWRPHPGLVAVALLAQARIVAGARHMAREAFGVSRPTNYDELRVAILTGIPVEVFVTFGLAVLLVSGAWLARRFPAGRRLAAAVAMLGGMGAGLFLYARVYGPWLLP